ncbi:MAG TPA: membrane protein insertion efficiency factor YidD [Candidatus Paceibacterota bacterium]|nr:membrane protein insertion efficiency factor YidD [Candidatus Paceibacterota bacterium]
MLLIEVYRLVFSPSVGILRYLPFYPAPSCVFYPTCSEYGKICFNTYPFFTASKKLIGRLSRCTPHHTPSVDLP